VGSKCEASNEPGCTMPDTTQTAHNSCPDRPLACKRLLSLFMLYLVLLLLHLSTALLIHLLQRLSNNRVHLQAGRQAGRQGPRQQPGLFKRPEQAADPVLGLAARQCQQHTPIRHFHILPAQGRQHALTSASMAGVGWLAKLSSTMASLKLRAPGSKP
jgi:hypothetical protein